jgi:hypothetical protein
VRVCVCVYVYVCVCVVWWGGGGYVRVREWFCLGCDSGHVRSLARIVHTPARSRSRAMRHQPYVWVLYCAAPFYTAIAMLYCPVLS